VYLKLSDDTTIPILGVQDAAIAKKKIGRSGFIFKLTHQNGEGEGMFFW
jgi:hypothetical protein